MSENARLNEMLGISIDPGLFRSHESALMPPAIAAEPHQFIDSVRASEGDVFPIIENMIGGVHFPTLIPMDASQPYFMVTGYAAVNYVVMNQNKFYQNHTYNMDLLMGTGQIAGLNPPGHIGLRALIFQAFNKQSVDILQEKAIVPLMSGLIDSMMQRDQADLVRDFTCRVPILLMSEIFGLEPSRCNEFAKLASDLMNFGASWPNAISASNRLEELFLALIDERKRSPGEDLISNMLQAEVDGRKLSDTEMMSFCRALVPAGVETTTRALSTLFTAVLTTPGCWVSLKGNRELVSAAVDEALRWNGPAQMIPKRTTTELELSGVKLAADTNIFVYLGQANRDAARWDNPHAFNPERERRPHLAFSKGAHTCLGNQLARREMHDALNLMLDRIPDLRLDPDAPLPKVMGIQHRSADRIDVLIS